MENEKRKKTEEREKKKREINKKKRKKRKRCEGCKSEFIRVKEKQKNSQE